MASLNITTKISRRRIVGGMVDQLKRSGTFNGSLVIVKPRSMSSKRMGWRGLLYYSLTLVFLDLTYPLKPHSKSVFSWRDTQVCMGETRNWDHIRDIKVPTQKLLTQRSQRFRFSRRRVLGCSNCSTSAPWPMRKFPQAVDIEKHTEKM